MRLGWRLVRVWSTDWFRNAKACVNRLHEEIERAIAESESKPEFPDFADMWKPPSEDCAVVEAEPDLIVDQQADRHGIEPSISPTSAEGGESYRLANELRNFRESIIMGEFPGSEPNRSILREDMIQQIVKAGLTDPDDFHAKIPFYLRSRTDGRQLQYLDRICDIVAKYVR
jgi:hypothetical protein